MKKLLIAASLLAQNLLLAQDPSSSLETTMQSEDKTDNSLMIGDWSAELDLGIMKVTLVLHAVDTEGALSATIDCVEQGIKGASVDSISFADSSLNFEIKNLKCKFAGSLLNNEIVGKFNQMGKSVSVSFKRGNTEKTLNRPQEPTKPYPYIEEEVSYENPDAGVILSATLTLPKTTPCPIVLLVPGSGPANRNLEVMGHKIFLVLADYLTRQGIGVLRYDKRGCGESTGNYETATIYDFANDVNAGINYLKTRKEASQIGLIGASEGGITAPLAASKSKDVSFLVMMAGPAAPCDEVLIRQGILIQRSMGASEEQILADSSLRIETFEIMKSESDSIAAEKKLREAISNHIATLADSLKKGPNSYQALVEANTESAIQMINNPWYRSFISYDPRPILREIKIPVLALNGELDVQVCPKQNLPYIAEALSESGNSDFTTMELPKTNHLFQICETGAISEYDKIEETSSPLAQKIISEWILKRTSKKPANVSVPLTNSN